MIQYILAFLSLGFQVYKYVNNNSKCKKERRARRLKFLRALERAKNERDTRELEDLLYELGFSGNDYGKLPDAKGHDSE